MNKSAEGVPGQGFEFLKSVTAEDRKQSPVDIDDFLCGIILINEETAGDLITEPEKRLQRLFRKSLF